MNQKGQTTVEYIMILSAVVGLAFGVMRLFEKNSKGIFDVYEERIKNIAEKGTPDGSPLGSPKFPPVP